MLYRTLNSSANRPGLISFIHVMVWKPHLPYKTGTHIMAPHHVTSSTITHPQHHCSYWVSKRYMYTYIHIVRVNPLLPDCRISVKDTSNEDRHMWGKSSETVQDYRHRRQAWLGRKCEHIHKQRTVELRRYVGKPAAFRAKMPIFQRSLMSGCG